MKLKNVYLDISKKVERRKGNAMWKKKFKKGREEILVRKI